MTTPLAETPLPALPLEGLRVGISGAVPEREFWGEVRDLDRLVLRFVAQLCALVIRNGGQVVHGSQPLLTPVVAEQARRQSATPPPGAGLREGVELRVPWRERTEPLKLYASQLFGDPPEATMRAARAARAPVVLTAKMGEGDDRDPVTRNKSLTAMRLAMTQELDVLVAIGGKLHRRTGFSPGVLEELAHARWHQVPCFVIGAFGGAAGRLEREVIEELSTGNLLGNESVQNLDLATWSETMDEYVGKLLVHLARHKQQFRRRERAGAASGPILRYMVRHALPTDVPGGTINIAYLDPAAVDKWSERVSDLMLAVQKTDVGRARELLVRADA